VSSRILVVEDEADLLLAIRILLEGHGYEVLDAPTGADGLRLVQRERPDLVVLDVGLPDVDGLDVLATLREIPDAERPVVVMLSAHASGHTADRARQLGCDRYVTKPFDPDELVETIDSLLVTGSAAP